MDTESYITFPDICISKSNSDREIVRNNHSVPSSYCSISLTQKLWSKTADVVEIGRCRTKTTGVRVKAADVGLKQPMFLHIQDRF